MAGAAGVAAAPASHAAPTAARPHADKAPAARTGGFGEPTCHECHFELPVNQDGSLTVEGFPGRYEPGRTYEVRVTLASEGTERAGFQAAVRRASGPGEGTQAGRLAPVDPRTMVQDTAGVQYVQHARGASWTGGAPAASWSFAWTAPDGGPVVLHAAANSSNGDESPLGDIVYTAEARSVAR